MHLPKVSYAQWKLDAEKHNKSVWPNDRKQNFCLLRFLTSALQN
jgi:hypothetical protein